MADFELDFNQGCYLINTGTLNEGELPIYKIGKSFNIMERVKNHRTSSPLSVLVKAFPFEYASVDQNRKSLRLNAMEKHIHRYLQSHAFDTQGGGTEFYCFDNDGVAIDKVCEAIKCAEVDVKLIPTPTSKKPKIKRKAKHSFQDINLTIRKVSKGERAQVSKELSDWHCIHKRLVVPTEEEAIKDGYEEVHKVVDEKGRICWNKAGLPIPRYLRDDYMLTHYDSTVIWYSENQPDILHDDLNENYQHYQKIRNRNLINAGLA